MEGQSKLSGGALTLELQGWATAKWLHDLESGNSHLPGPVFSPVKERAGLVVHTSDRLYHK